MKNKLCFFVLTMFLLLSFPLDNFSQSQDNKPKYVFFLIGDGMGMSHINLTEAYLSQLDNEIGVKKLTLSSFPVVGLSTTYAETRYVTGSAAAGTALATGFKTSIGTISLKSNHKDTLFSIAYYAKKKGMKIGILSSVGINHATPAVFYAHQQKRSQYYEIALQLYKSNFDFFGGGGFIDYKGENNTLESVYDITEKYGYVVSNNVNEIMSFKDKDKKYLCYSPDILSQAEFPYAIDQKEGFFNLADFTKKAIELLFSDNGFFMMVEGGKIDWAAHDNDATTIIYEILDFDEVVKVAYDFYLLHPDETLIVVTADHETGGVSIGCDKQGYDTFLKLLFNQKMSLSTFSDTLNNLFVAGKINSFENVLDIGENYLLIEKKSLDKAELQKLETAFEQFNANKTEITKGLYESNNPIAIAWIEILNDRAGVGWTSHSHSGTPVPVFAIGVGSEEFEGYFDNTDIPRKIAKLLGIILPEFK